MSRIDSALAALRAQSRKALIPYVTAGFPYPDSTPALMHGMAEAGADIIELGVPFSDPAADGPVIQQAGDRALAHGIGLAQVLDIVRAFRQQDDRTPVVLMGYANPVERYDQRLGDKITPPRSPASHGALPLEGAAPPWERPGGSAFVRDAAKAGVDGVLIVDYPPEECAGFAAQLKAHGIDLIFLLAPTSTEQRMKQVAQLASGYVYYVSLKGVTGSGALDTAQVQAMLPRIREHVKIPVGVGFGIRDADTARAIGQVADAVVIGTRLIQVIADQPQEKVVAAAMDFLRPIRAALDSKE
ncbi:MAG: tryptophan synthase subunit alpha [Burkholderiaceae bacterium]|jgi:tryptophan synthase alpha chain|nr:tryptophan synthase subunit alpha [Burkholderiaceae bacterium]